mgnify:CR=1 FL=1
MSYGLHLWLLAVCLVGGAFFAGIETGIVSINRLRLRHLVLRRVRGARLLERFVRDPDLMLGTTLIGTNLCHVVATVSAASIGARLGGDRGVAAAGALLTVVVLVFCEYLPKAWFQSFAARRTLPFAPILYAVSWIFAPFRWILTFLVGRLLGALPVQPRSPPLLTREDLLHLASEGESSGVLTAHETRMIRGIFELSGMTCRDIMIPRSRMVTVDQDMPAERVLELAREKRLHRFPVWHAKRKAFIGVVHVFDIVRDRNRAGWTAEHYCRPPQLVGAQMLVDHVLPRMRVTRQPMMLVTDDRFEVIGLLTLNDVLNEIVGQD